MMNSSSRLRPPPEPTEKRPHRWTVWLSLGALAVAGVSAFYTYRQADDAHQARLDAKAAADAQAKDVERSRRAAEESARAADMLADAANRNATAAQETARTSTDSLNRSIEQFRLDERARIVLEPPEPKLRAPTSETYRGALFTYEFFLKNVGKTSALKIAVRAPRASIDGALTLGDDPSQIESVQKMLRTDTIFPGVNRNDQVILLSERNAKVLAPGAKSFSPFELYGQEPRFQRYRYLIGRIDYEDVFGIKHWNTFCFFINPGGALAYCLEGNDEDRNPKLPPERRR